MRDLKKKNYVKRMENKFEMLPHAVETKIFCQNFSNWNCSNKCLMDSV